MQIELLEVFGTDLTVVNAARVSFGKESLSLSDKDIRLIKYLAKYKHISPFFHPQLRFRLKMPIWMAREWFRHEVGFARNEISRRYVESDPEVWVPDHLFSRSESGNKQGHSEILVEDEGYWREFFDRELHHSADSYIALLRAGVAPEFARGILPMNTMTEFIETGSLAAYARLVQLRNTESANDDIRTYANNLAEYVKQAFPVSWEALMS